MLGLGNEPAHQRPDRVGAEEHRFLDPARMQQARGEDVAALGICTELDFVDSEEIDLPLERHRFGSTDKIRWVRRQDFLLAGNQRNRARPAQPYNPVVVFTGEQPEREADHAAAMAEHALDGKMGLAGIGRPEDRDEPRSGAEHAHALRYWVNPPSAQEQTRAATLCQELIEFAGPD